VDPEKALRRANAKFERRFRGVEQAVAAGGGSVGEATLDEMEAHWVAVKQAEKAGR
jgi:ATP diphosphatase